MKTEKMLGRAIYAAIVCLVLMLVWTLSAEAQEQNQWQAMVGQRSGETAVTPLSGTVRASARQQQQQQNAQSVDVGVSASAAGGSNGDQVSLNSSQFYALSLMFPNAIDCFTGVQGGAADEGTSGFLGLHLLNKSCWLQKQASVEQDIEINARLKCADKHYRNALAYNAPKRDRQTLCIQMKMESAKRQMKLFNEQLRMAELRECEDRTEGYEKSLARCEQTLKQDK